MCLVLLLAVCLMCTGCIERSIPTAAHKDQIEIAPGKWLVVSAEDTIEAGPKEEWSSLVFEWNGSTVKWRGPEIPITLREHEGTLYMIGFNRENLDHAKFVPLRLNLAGDGFKTIERGEFPRSIATQNMWLRQRTRYINVMVGGEGKLVDQWAELRKLDIDGPGFGKCMTSRIWYYLVTGKQSGEERWDPEYDISPAFLREYVEKYKPIALPTIVKEPTEAGGQGKEDK